MGLLKAKLLVLLALPVLIGLIGMAPCGEAAREARKGATEGKGTRRAAKEAARKVRAIANRNKPPKIVGRRAVWPSRFPIFHKDYDWKEEERVRKALHRLEQDTSAELWEALVQKANDERYCIISYNGSSSDPEAWSVGGVCHNLAYHRLCGVFEEHLPSVPPHGCPIELESVQEDLTAWRKARADKPLYQLQIEVCEMAVRELRKLDAKDMSAKMKAEARKAIQAEVAKLRRLKRPLMGPEGVPPGYPRAEARRVREAFEKGTLESFQSGLNK